MIRGPRVIVPVLLLVGLCRLGRAEEPQTPASPPPRHDDGRRTTGRFLANLGRGVVGVVSRESLVPLLVGGAVTAAGLPFGAAASPSRPPGSFRRASWVTTRAAAARTWRRRRRVSSSKRPV